MGSSILCVCAGSSCLWCRAELSRGVPAGQCLLPVNSLHITYSRNPLSRADGTVSWNFHLVTRGTAFFLMGFCSTGDTCPACRMCPVQCPPSGAIFRDMQLVARLETCNIPCCPFPCCEQSPGGYPCVLQPSFATDIRIGLKSQMG